MSEVQTPAAAPAAPTQPATQPTTTAPAPAGGTAAELYQQPAGNPQVQTPQAGATPATTADPKSEAQKLYAAPEQPDQQQGQQPTLQDQKEQQAQQVPEQYDFKGVVATNGLEITDTDRSLVSELGKAAGLTNEQARKVLEVGGRIFGDSIASAVQAQTELNIAEVQRDPELGGTHYNQTRTNLSRINERYIKNNAEAQRLLEASGLMYHPAIVRLFNAIGKDIGEEQLYAGNGSNRAPTKVNRLRALYNNSPDMDFGD